ATATREKFRMLLFERQIAGLIGYRKAFFASEMQLTELVHTLRPFQILRSFAGAAIVSNGTRPVVQNREKTALVDLTKGQGAIYARMHTNCRYKVRRAEKLSDRIEICENTEEVRRDFLTLHHG